MKHAWWSFMPILYINVWIGYHIRNRWFTHMDYDQHYPDNSPYTGMNICDGKFWAPFILEEKTPI